MKHLSLLTLTLFLALVGCSESKKSSSSSTTNNSGSSCSGEAYYCQSGCAGYNSGYNCSNYTGSTSGSSTGGSTTGGTGSTSYNKIPHDPNWMGLYKNGEPTGSCSTPTGSGYNLRVGTVTMSGGVYYSPDLSWTGVGESEYTSIRYSHNVSSFLSDVTQAQAFIDTDSVLRVRFKPRLQPLPPKPSPSYPNGRSWCFGRLLGQTQDAYGYTKLRFTAALKGTDGILKGTRTFDVGVNSCSPAADWSTDVAPGDVIVIRDVYSNTGCTTQSGCTTWKKVRDGSCWMMDIEVQVDGTKAIP